MSTVILSPHARRRLEKVSGRPLLRAWGHGHVSLFTAVTPEHEHVTINRLTGDVEVDEPPIHTTSCRYLFSDKPCPECGHRDHRPVGCHERVHGRALVGGPEAPSWQCYCAVGETLPYP